ncbi:ABC transporter permease subunit [Streptomyces sp. SID13666]|uniref:ABC transporter permease n=1 Tax=Streptomyces TaxID=1883 RepID=UPI00110622A2|nr:MULTISPECIES: ABC transporter permease subunit [Streptomyces]MCZ4098215.1 ABC transporter permease subunit [Streptomyces sp. H39-C1]NEA55556.1 ABC transporter permease subunit [Streptomyces sp. SID13666]NEA71759.1 ABC transporter permease subunit [Streptomyces sp. SID13588]QNA73239.1 ABC transporter permease subunit [Streptomyces sp. So13.3]
MARLTRKPLWRGAVGLLAGLYFLVPVAASVIFTVDVPGQGFTLDAYSGIVSADGFTDSLLLTLELAAATIVLVMVLLVPALVAVRLGAPRLRPVLEIICSLPLVVPSVALVSGYSSVLRWGPEHLSRTPLFQTFTAVQDKRFPFVLVLAYTVMALPLAYRALDSGLRAVDVRVLVEAARSCGASAPRAVLQVVLPNLRGALLNASFLTLALVLGEYTVGALLGYQPFAVWIVNTGGNQAQLSVAVSVLSLVVTWMLLLVFAALGRPRDRSRSLSRSRRAGRDAAAPAPIAQEVA